MKAIVEHPLQMTTIERYHKEMMQFARILQDITEANTLSELKSHIAYSFQRGQNDLFSIGWGANHMWAKQKDPETGKATGERIIFVDFTVQKAIENSLK